MGRIDSTEDLKPHEIALRKLCLDSHVYDLVLASLGLKNKPLVEFEKLLDNGIIRQLDDVSRHFSPKDFSKLEKLKLNAKKVNISGKWVKEGDNFSIEDSDNYAKKLNDAIHKIYPDFGADSQKIPVTLLLPSSIKEDVFKLEGTPSKWEFITIQDDDKKTEEECAFGLSALAALAAQAKLAFALRLFLSFKFLGLTNTQQSKKNGSRLFLDIIRSLNIEDQFDLLNCNELKDWSKRYKQREKLQLKINTLQRQDEELDSKYKSDTATNFNKKKARREVIHNKISDLESKIDNISLSDVQPTGMETTDSFYYTLPSNLCEMLNIPNYPHTYTFPTLKTKVESHLKFTSVCLGQDKKNDPTALIRDTDKMRLMMCYLCSMTSGTAITFYVDKKMLEGSKALGITSPTLVLPEVWCDLALGLKQHNSNQDVTSMSNDDYEASDPRKNYVSAIHGTYLAKQGEILRIIPNI